MTTDTGRQQAADPVSADGDDPRVGGLRQLGRVVGAVVAPTTLVTALLYYFGWSFSFAFYDDFGISYTVVGLGTTDYLITSVDGLFTPMAIAAAATLLALWGHAAFGTRLATVRHLVPGVAAVGALLTVLGFAHIYVSTPLTQVVAAAPLSLGVGVLLLAYANHMYRVQGRRTGSQWAGIAEWAVVFVLVGMSLFWAVSDYSVAVANSRAREQVEALPSSPGVTIFSEKGLNLHVPGVRETRCHTRQAAYGYRYDGLKLLRRSGDQYLFLPGQWTRANGVAVLLPRNDTIRLEFTPAATTTTSPTC